ncbi:MAG: 50S ribosomal protein L20 [Candidatus Brocadiia bacterium]
MRVKTGVARHHRTKRIMKQASGFDQGRHRLFRTAKETLIQAGRDAFFGRKLKKRDFRGLWITRLTAALRAAGFTYSKFINDLKKSKIELNRKMLSELAISDQNAFNKILESVKS